MTRIAVLHPGEMGSSVGRELVRAGHDVGWLPIGRSVTTQDRAGRAGIRTLTDLSAVDVVLSVCPPGAAVSTAQTVGAFAGRYVDANAISPDTAADVAVVVTDNGGSYVDGGLIGAPPTAGSPVRLALSGPDAGEIAELFTGTDVHATVLDAGGFSASALKMTYAAWTKISQALLLTADGAARELGVVDALHEEWADSQPQLTELLEHARTAAARKGWRWEAEMREIARTFAATGRPDGFGTAAASVFGSYPRPASS